MECRVTGVVWGGIPNDNTLGGVVLESPRSSTCKERSYQTYSVVLGDPECTSLQVNLFLWLCTFYASEMGLS